MERFRQMGDQELEGREADLRDQLFRLRFQMSLGQSESIKKLRQLRRDIARVKTLATERARAAAGGGK
ncbi:MAG TPA: 50S ribosomal protein L29 [Terriglobales bacterium]|jgi:large subunit ribosomal protein L29|nr:50S ribosomal protein L29 [Terriglobales bacterium]